MTTYREKDGNLVREYELDLGDLVRKESEKALIELIPTKEYGLALFLNNELQLTEKDEYIYHEMLVHPCLSNTQSRKRVCIIGGGDGCAAREVLRWGSDVESIDIIDWDKRVTNLFRTYFYLNDDSFSHPKVNVINENIRAFLHDERTYDCILIDLLDPNPREQGQEDLWYDILFMAKHWIAEGGSIVINAGGILPWNMENLEWLLELVGRKMPWPIHLYKVFVPSFAREWCFLLLTPSDKPNVGNLPSGLRYISSQAWAQAYSYGWTLDYRRNLHLNIEHQIPADD